MSEGDDHRPRRRGRRWLPAVGLAISAHLAVILALAAVSPRGPTPAFYPEQPVAAIMMPPPPPPPLPEKPAPEPTPKPEKTPEPPAAAAPRKAPPATPKPAAREPSPAKPVVKTRIAKTPPPPDVETVAAPGGAEGDPSVLLGEADLAGAITAGSGQGAGGGNGLGGGGGGQCDMVQRLQDRLRRDGEVRNAVIRAHQTLPTQGKAILLWNGEWLRSPGQEGKGLAGVRQAIALEVAFAPAACRAQPVRGRVLLSLSDGPGGARLALGQGTWRWSDLLSARR